MILWYVVYKILIYRLFKVNGQPIIIHGGNWILSDGLLRLSKERYKTDIKFHADMRFNMIHCWGGGLAERTEFYHYCDIYGLLVISLSLSLPLLFVCVFWVWSIIEGIYKIEIEILNEQSHREHRDRDLHGSDLDICPMAGIEMKNLLKRVTTIVAQNKALDTPNELFLTNNKYYGYKVGLATFCGDYVTK